MLLHITDCLVDVVVREREVVTITSWWSLAVANFS